jgi:hypothetical protein
VTRQPSVVRTGGGEGHGCLVAERTVPPAVVVVLLPVGDHDAGLGTEEGSIQITQAARIGEHWTPRELRHSFVSILSDNGVSI